MSVAVVGVVEMVTADRGSLKKKCMEEGGRGLARPWWAAAARPAASLRLKPDTDRPTAVASWKAGSPGHHRTHRRGRRVVGPASLRSATGGPVAPGQ